MLYLKVSELRYGMQNVIHRGNALRHIPLFDQVKPLSPKQATLMAHLSTANDPIPNISSRRLTSSHDPPT